MKASPRISCLRVWRDESSLRNEEYISDTVYSVVRNALYLVLWLSMPEIEVIHT